MRIAVCDDEITILEILQKQLEELPQVSQTLVFSVAERLFRALERGCQFDVVFMDIDWKKEKNGIDFAEELLRISPNTQVIYVTGYNDRFSQQIFLKKANLCGFLVKPVQAEMLEALLEKAKKNIEKQETEKLLISQNGVVYAFPFRDITYFESAAHRLAVHTADGCLFFYGKLEMVKQQLPPCFFQCHKSFLVNMDYIRRIDKRSIFLKTGEEIPISKVKYAETRTAYFRYMGDTL